MPTTAACILILAAAQQTPSVAGLQPGETVRELGPPAVLGDAAPAANTWIHGRVIDAATALPVAGAVVEAWTEEIDARSEGFFRVGEARSRRDGRFSIRRAQGELTADKVRVVAPGYLVFSGTCGDLFDTLPLVPEDNSAALRLRVVDVEGRPIAGARVTSTESCAHDLPAFALHSDSMGEVELRGFGLQHHVPDLRVQAAGYTAVKYLDLDEALIVHPRSEPIEVTLRSCVPFAIKLLDAAGAPLPGRTLYVVDGDGYHVVRTDAAAIARIATRYSDDVVIVKLFDRGRDFFISELIPIAGTTVTARVGSNDGWPEATPTGTVRFAPTLRPEGEEIVPVCLQHDQGWVAWHREEADECEFPVGEITAIVGTERSTSAQRVRRLTVGAGETVTVDLPAAGLQPRAAKADPEPDPVTDAESAPELSAEHRIRFTSSVDGAAFGVDEVRVVRGGATELRAGSDGVVLHGVPGQSALIRAERAGHARVWQRIHFGEAPTRSTQSVPALAKLSIAAPFDLKIVGSDALDLDALTPGPLDLVVEGQGGRRYGLSIRIEAGAERRIVIQR